MQENTAQEPKRTNQSFTHNMEEIPQSQNWGGGDTNNTPCTGPFMLVKCIRVERGQTNGCRGMGAGWEGAWEGV